ncbi:MAG: peptidoglycan DD-metalloendopeptidase family protein [Planctomycetes bacterium]|nr:peptidoglycan DD-metalloendopeptidase family protein [Planctomycetota bacterium]
MTLRRLLPLRSAIVGATAVAVTVTAIALAVSASVAADLVGWGADVNTGSGPVLIDATRADLAAIVKAAPADRKSLIAKFVTDKGLSGIEAAKRFRNPELKELFVALLDHADWRVKHRALFALDYYGDSTVLAKAWPLVKSEVPRLREKAVLSCIKLWDAKVGAAALGGDPAAAVAERLRDESDDHVRTCLAALTDRIASKLRVERVYDEFLRADPDGLKWTPFLEGMDKVAQVAPGYVKKGVSKGGGGDAAKLGPSSRWTGPLLGFGDEEVKGTSLQPFANLRSNGTVYHTGQDVGACLDGAGFYAAADGFVRWVLTGTDMGTLMVLSHSPDGRESVNAVYMHGGDTVFVTGGDRVRAGQLLGTMGMSYSIENGGHFAHLHYGLYPGNFSEGHNYGYKPVSAGLADWIDPGKFIPLWTDRTRPFVAPLRAVDASLAKAVDAARDGALGRAWTEADRVAKKADATDAQRADAAYIQEQITAACDEVCKRAAAQRDAGWPSFALSLLQRQAAEAKGVPAASKIAADAAQWPKDPAFQKSLKAEAAFELASAKASKMLEKKEPAEKLRAVFEDLLKDWGDTSLRARIEERVAMYAAK